jgi:hypothetical protein
MGSPPLRLPEALNSMLCARAAIAFLARRNHQFTRRLSRSAAICMLTLCTTRPLQAR